VKGGMMEYPKVELAHLYDDGELLGEVANLTGVIDMEFLQAVKELMRHHKVNYLRLCWNHFNREL